MPLDHAKVKDIHEEDWEKYVTKGETFYNRKVSSEVLQEAFRFQGDIEGSFSSWHWVKYGSGESWPTALYMNDALTDLGIPTATGGWVFHHRDHEDQGETYKVNGKHYVATGAMIEVVMNKINGVLVVKNHISPQEKAKVDKVSLRNNELPKLQRGSDLILGLWNMTEPTNEGLGSLKYFILHGIISHNSQQAIKHILKENGRDNIRNWKDKLTIDMSTDAGMALLGIPNSYALGYLLNQHPDTFGSRTVSKIDIFEHGIDREGNKHPVLIYHISD